MRVSVSSPGYVRPEANCVRNAAANCEVHGYDEFPFTIASVSATTSGRPLVVIVSGDGNPDGAGLWCRVQISRDIGSGYVPMSSLVQLEAEGANINVPYSLHFLDTGIASLTGTPVTYALQATILYGTWTFGEANGPDISVFEI